MATTLELEQQKQIKQHERETLNALIGEQVINTLGKPNFLQKVQVRPLWEDYYRVNVFVGVDSVSGKVAHSYFLVADGEGNVLVSTPKITRQY